ncbi:MAG: hypothetical protein AAGI30_02410 [Planctomycetota bacterium]
MRPRLLLVLLAAALGHQMGCGSRLPTEPPPPLPEEIGIRPVDLRPGDYADAFEIARDMLRDRGFVLARVDARQGVITTQPSSASGLATPWRRQTSGFNAAVDATLNRERRAVALRFRALDDQARPLSVEDLRQHGGVIQARFDVVVQRVYEAGRRVTPTSIRLTTRATDPAFPSPDGDAFGSRSRGDESLSEALHVEFADRLATALLSPNNG